MLRPQGHYPSRRRNLWDSTEGVLAIFCAILVVLIGLAIGCPPASEWISAAVEAEYNMGTELPAPTQIARPVEIRTVRAD